MKSLFSIAIVTATIATTNQAGACTLRLPSFELAGFPISRHQVAVLGATHVRESAATATLTLAGMPASPHQIAVLTPRARNLRMAEASADPRLVTIGLTSLSVEKSARQISCAPD
jgi:hypothetical protein